MKYYFRSSTIQLRVDPRAFTSTKDFTRYLKIDNCDLEQLDIGFLTGFNYFEAVTFASDSGFHQSFSTLPKLPKLSQLKFEASRGLYELTDFPVLAKGLEVFRVTESPGFDDASASRILDWLLVSSQNTLKELEFRRQNELKMIPSQLGSFPHLYRLLIEGAKLPLLRKDFFKFSAPVLRLSLTNSDVQLVEPGTFQGKIQKQNRCNLC